MGATCGALIFYCYEVLDAREKSRLPFVDSARAEGASGAFERAGLTERKENGFYREGERDMTEEMPKVYDPSENEPKILQKWLDGGYYKRRAGVGDCTVTIPPPNVTGKLHMGHATDDSIQDADHPYGAHAR